MTGFLVLDSGEVFEGNWLGGGNKAGEVVFNTSHSGYEEIATDPSYFNQIVLLTAPMQGNYSIDPKHWESKNIWINGFISLQIQNSNLDRSWLKQLTDNQIPVLTEVDTRKITLRLRSGGTPWGAIIQAQNKNDALKLAQNLIAERKKIQSDWVYEVSTKSKYSLKGEKINGPRIAMLDFGSKENIQRELLKRCSELMVFPSRTSAQDLLAAKPQGLMLTNGPGDPADVQIATETVRSLIGSIPIFGICMGHQILSLALGAKTYKLKFGHRGANHPIDDQLLKKIYMTSQNHGYAVLEDSLPSGVQVTHRNLNDKTVAGIFHPQKNCLGIQYHPESHPGPHDAVELFDFFIEKMLR